MNYEVSDTYLAGYLLASGLPLVSNRREGHKTIFCFAPSDKLSELVDDYFNMHATINPLSYGSALKILKNIIYQKDHNDYDNQPMFNQQRRAN